METNQIRAPRSRRLLGQAAIAGALALLLGSQMAHPAGAASRQMAVDQANAFISDCFANGGQPDAATDEEGGYATATCDYGPDIESDTCTYYYDSNTPYCYTDLVLPKPPTGRGRLGGGAVQINHAPISQTAALDSGGGSTPPGGDAPTPPPDDASPPSGGDHAAGTGSAHAPKHRKGHKRHGRRTRVSARAAGQRAAANRSTR